MKSIGYVTTRVPEITPGQERGERQRNLRPRWRDRLVSDIPAPAEPPSSKDQICSVFSLFSKAGLGKAYGRVRSVRERRWSPQVGSMPLRRSFTQRLTQTKRPASAKRGPR